MVPNASNLTRTFYFFLFCFSFCWGTRRYQPDIQNGLPSIDGFVLLGSGHDDDGDAARLAKVTLRVSSARQVCSMFSIARRGLEKAAAATEETKEASVNEARVALLHALRRAERVLVNRDDEVRVVFLFFFLFFFFLLVFSDDKHRDYYRCDSFAAVNFFFLFSFSFFWFVFFLYSSPSFLNHHRLIIVQ